MICDICDQDYPLDEMTDKNICLNCEEMIKHNRKLEEIAEETGGIILPKLDDKPKTVCWSCEKEYPENCYNCPHCKMYNPFAIFIDRRK